MPINYVKGDATKPNGNGTKIIMHICNNKGGWGAGFVVALSKKWKAPEKSYREWSKCDNDPKNIDRFDLGMTQFVGVGGGIIVANMVAQDGFGGVAVKYDHLRKCLKQVCEYAKGINASVHAPMIGTGLGGGKWEIISKIIEEELCNQGVEVTVYEFEK
jgi:O-acetyl-ADP-ribose deacetylase (regulator of RNase III)